MQTAQNIEHQFLLDNPDYDAFDFEFENMVFHGRNGSHMDARLCTK